jgi:Sugar (and other) transporter
MFLAMFTLPESVRWLLSHNRGDEAWKSLTWMRGDDGPKTLDEFNETQAGLSAEHAATDNFTLSELWHPSNRMRFFVGPAMFVFQNTTGSSALAVFAPEYFKLVVGGSGNTDLLLTGLFGAIKVVGCTFFIFFMAERFARRTLLVSGALGMAICMMIIPLIVKYDATTTASGGVSNAGRATVAMIYLDIVVSLCCNFPLRKFKRS